mgnify:CR=1 FL=1
MIARKLLLVATSGLFLSACGLMPSGSSEPPSSAEATSPSDTQAAVDNYPGIEVITSSPERFSRQLGRYTVYERTSCNRDSERREAFAATLQKLQAKAAEDGADTVRVLGTGALESRGLCNNDMFQLTGVAFREENIQQNQASGGARGGPPNEFTTPPPVGPGSPAERWLIFRNEDLQLRAAGLKNPL